MKKQVLNSRQSLTGLMVFLFTFLSLGQSFAQGPCPDPCPASNQGALNPGNPPMCQAPGADPFKVLLVLDESGSINIPTIFEPQVEAAVLGFAATLESRIPSAGRMQMGIVEFSSTASTPIALTDVKSPGFVNAVNNYLSANDGSSSIANYNPNGGTNYVEALKEAKKSTGVDIIFFISDGNPDPPVPITDWRNIADAIKGSGTYIFGIALGFNVCECNIIALSGPDELNAPKTLPEGADWAQSGFGTLGDDLATFALSLIDTHAPLISCSGNIRDENDPGKCGKVVNYITTVSDDCPNATLVCTPPPGSFFNVGQTVVNCKATDNVGNASTCSFKVTILDSEAPKVTCPPGKTISCEESSAPGNTGSPTATDNCAVGTTIHADVRVDGSCPNEFTLNRTWTVSDVHGNFSTCLQVIAVEDKKSPVIKCPVNITVTCDTTAAKTGMATATDNCDVSVSMSRRDIHISGDCDWFCITERHWKATDDCGNASKCVQVITKDVTPLIETALASGPLKWGQTGATVTLPAGRGACVVKWLPYSGVVPTALKFDDAVANAECGLMTNPLDAAGHIVNPLLGEAMKLKILVRLNPALGTTKLSAIPCEMHFIVRQALASNPDVNELLRVTDLTLGNINVNLLVPEHTVHLLNVLKCVNAGRTVCKP